MSYSGPGLILSACKIDGHGSNELALSRHGDDIAMESAAV